MFSETALYRDYAVPMRDGVHLSCRVGCSTGDPETSGVRYAVILNLCTDYTEEEEVLLRPFIGHGLAVLRLLFRGRGGSGGLFSLDQGTHRDLEDFFAWLQGRPWYGGRCGFYGSGAGATIGLRFSQQHPGLLGCLALDSFLVSYSRRWLYRNGVFELPNLRRLLDLACSSPRCLQSPEIRNSLEEMRRQFFSYARYWPHSPGSTPLSLLPEYEKIALDFIRSCSRESADPRRQYTDEQFFAGYPSIPLLLTGRWGDHRLRSVLKCYYELSYRREFGLQCFISGGGSGGISGPERCFRGEESFGDYMLGWFRHHLCGPGEPRFSEKKICYESLQPGVLSPAAVPVRSWASFWPPEEQEIFFYLQPGFQMTGSYSRSDNGHCGSTFFSDPRHPVIQVSSSGQADSSPRRRFLPYLRGDILTFTGTPLKKPVRLAGNARIRLYLHCTAPDGDLYCRLSCLPESAAGDDHPSEPVFLCDSIQRFSCYRQTRMPSIRIPSYCRLYEFSLSPMAAVLPAGSRILLELSGSSFPRFAVCNQTGIEDFQGSAGPVSYYRIYHNQQCPSCLILPVLSMHSGKHEIAAAHHSGSLSPETDAV